MLGAPVFRTALYGPWSGNALWTAARAVPSLDLRFAESKSLTDAASGANLVTFTRASSGTYVGSDGVLKTATTNEPRFDHNPTTGESLGLLVEEQRTNLLLQSEDFSTTWSASLCVVTTNTQIAPSGAQTADTLTDQNGSTGSPFALQTLTLADSTTYAMSCYLKAGTKTAARVGIRAKDGTIVVANFDLSAGTTTVGNATASSIQAVGNGWYRCVAICASATGATSQRGLVYIDTASYTANGTGTIHVWGAQLEAGAFPTSYIPTTTATATRSADVASITGTNFSSWYRQDEGTVFAETQLPAGTAVNTSSRSVIDATDGSTNNRVNIRAISSGTNQDQLTIRSGAVTIAQFGSSGTAVSSSARKIAAVYRLDDYASWATGAVTAATDTSGALPVGVNQITVGSAVGGGEFMSGTIRRLCYWGQRLPNSTLQSITQ